MRERSATCGQAASRVIPRRHGSAGAVWEAGKVGRWDAAPGLGGTFPPQREGQGEGEASIGRVCSRIRRMRETGHTQWTAFLRSRAPTAAHCPIRLSRRSSARFPFLKPRVQEPERIYPRPAPAFYREENESQRQQMT